jgi:hypothetical protein
MATGVGLDRKIQPLGSSVARVPDFSPVILLVSPVEHGHGSKLTAVSL